MSKYEALVIGIGNILWADEGFGVRAVEAYHKKFSDDQRVRVIDGGTLGAYLINEVMDAKRVLIFDCCDFRDKPGALKLLRNEDIALWSSTKISAHQAGMNDVLVMAALEGYEPQAISVIGVQPLELNDYGGSLTEVVAGKIDQALELAKTEMIVWGLEPTLRKEHELAEPLGEETLERLSYEKGRPSEKEAFRLGDLRFIVKSQSR